jgi:methylmalonyl-CoA mutase N-terminal domain/subunit
VSGYHIREAGTTAAQEAAFTLADGFAYVEDAMDRGLGVDEVAPQLSFFFNSHNSMLEEVAKFRASRRVYARIMDEWYDAEGDASKRLKFHTQTAGQSLTAQQPLNNIVRTTVQAMAAVGGTQSLHTNSYDEALALPSEDAVRVALRTQQILAEESGVGERSTRWAGALPSRSSPTSWRPRSPPTSRRSGRWATAPSAMGSSRVSTGATSTGRSRRRATSTSSASTPARRSSSG